MTSTLSVWWDATLVGQLRVDRSGRMRFAYAEDWLASDRPAISFSLPKREQPFSYRECRPFFAGLLPEDSQRDAAARALGISKGNDFAFLEALGGDVAGALSLWPESSTPPTPDPDHRPRPLSDDELVALLDTLPTRPLLAGREGLRLSLAGAQSKLPVVLVDGRVALPAPGQATTHILKPPIARFPHTTENEALAMALAASVGLTVAAIDARIVRGRACLLVERYDRRFDGDGSARRLHQEDFCQALGIPPEQKYAVEGGPTFKTSFGLLRRAATVPAVATLSLLDAAIFNLIIGNADAHGKNYSLLYEGGTVILAPLYDLLSTVVYEDLSPSLAMNIGGRRTLEEVGPTTWANFAEEIGIGERLVRRRVRELADAVHRTVSDVADRTAQAGLDRGALKNYSSVIQTRAERVARTSAK